jgi:nitrogen fixation/metabolism regulation signal transduction histidine kinase
VAQGKETVKQGQEAVKQGQETVARGKEVIVQSRKVSQVVEMNIAKEYADSPELAKVFKEAAAADDKKLQDEQRRLEGDAAFLEKRAKELETQAKDLEAQAAEVEIRQKTLVGGLVAVLTLLVVGIGLAGIVVTHRVAGPIFKMKRLLREIGKGKLVLREKLRKGDELQHFFETFEQMVMDLRSHQEGEIAKLDVIMAALEEAPTSQRGAKEVDAEGLRKLKKLRDDMQAALEA